MEMAVDGEAKEIWKGGAGYVLTLASGSSIPIRYHSLFGSHDDLLLLEVDEKLLPDILNHRTCIRGQPDEDAVFCTPTATYAMKFVGTSNTVLLIPPGDATSSNPEVLSEDTDKQDIPMPQSIASVIKVAPGNIELIQTAPRLEKLKTLLSQRPYRLEEDLDDDLQLKSGLYRWEDLVELIQASEGEIRVGLKSLSAVELDGLWRLVDQKSMDGVLDMILNNSILHDWRLNALVEDEVLSIMESDGFPRRIVLHCLDTYGNALDGMEGCLWSLDENKVCLRFAVRVLGAEKMKLDVFMEKWTRNAPSGMQVNLQMLEGEVLFEKIGIETWIRPFSVSALPSTPAERFGALFRERPKWEWKDLDPYIKDLKVPGLSAEALLIKYTRRTQPSADVEPVFSAR
ncbi:putative sister chromatid cohesion protein Dcc1 [Dioscorea sansibarensis]